MERLIKQPVQRPMKFQNKNRFFSGSRAVSSLPGNRILSFADLEAGWHYGGGIPIEHGVIIRALELLEDMISMGSRKFEEFPGCDGSIILATYYRDREANITVRQDGLYNFLLEENDIVQMEQDAISKNRVLAYMRFFEWKDPSPSVYSTRSTTRSKRVALTVPQYSLRTTVHQSSMKPVPGDVQGQFANIYRYSTHQG